MAIMASGGHPRERLRNAQSEPESTHSERQRDWIIVTPIDEVEPERRAEPVPALAGRDVIRLRPAEEWEAEREALAAELSAELDRLAAAIEEEISHLTRSQHEFENEDAIETLGRQLARITEARDAARSGSPVLLQSVALAMPGLQAAAASAVRSAAAEGSFQTGHLATEFTVEKLEKMAIADMAGQLTARNFAHLSDAQLDAIDRRLDRYMDDADRQQKRADARIESLADETGADLTAYRENRDRIRHLKEQAEAEADDVKRAHAMVLDAHNASLGLRAAGASAEEVAAADRVTEERRAAAELVARKELAREARSKGLSPAEAEQHIKQGTAAASQAILEDIGKLEQSYAASSAQAPEVTADRKLGREEVREERQAEAAVAAEPTTTAARFGFAAFNTSINPAQALGQQFAASRPKDATPIGAAQEADAGALGDLPKVTVNQAGEGKEPEGKTVG